MSEIDDGTVDLIVTSPPYPMIQMWDDIFSCMSAETGAALSEKDAKSAFELMHESLDRVWSECFRVLKPGGFACINIGDATRKIGDDFRLYPNHSRITQSMSELSFDCLPMIHWFKPTNAPNKFMGSGTLPSGAYVTLEHEYILVFRKGGRRSFSPTEQGLRRESAFFWEERNSWFSDVWNFKGASQPLDKFSGRRDRSGAFPYELPYRLINMYSLKGDTILDPFIGTGTSLAAALVCGRSSIGYESDESLAEIIAMKAESAAEAAAGLVDDRLEQHRTFIAEYIRRKGQPRYENRGYDFPVVTRQEKELKLAVLSGLSREKTEQGRLEFEADYRL